MPAPPDEPRLCRGEDIRDVYIMNFASAGTLGEGAFGTVFKATRRDDVVSFAVKMCEKEPKLPSSGPRSALRLSSLALESIGRKHIEQIKEEFSIMGSLRHPHIIRLHEIYEDPMAFYLVMDLCRGGELVAFIVESGFYREQHISIISQQALSALEYMHRKQVCHRDLKPENLMLLNREPIEQNEVQVIDFSVSCRFDTDEELRPQAGTLHFLAPQVVGGRYDKAADLWSFGATAYILLCGFPPFEKETQEATMKMIKKGNYVMRGPAWEDVSEDAKDFIRHLLRMDAQERLSATKALEHQWIKDRAAGAADIWLNHGLENLRRYNKIGKRKANVPFSLQEERNAMQKQAEWEDYFQSWMLSWIRGSEPSPADIERQSQAAGLAGYLELYGASLPPTATLAPLVQKALEKTLVGLGLPAPPVRIFVRPSRAQVVGPSSGVIGDGQAAAERPSEARLLRIGATPHETHGPAPVMALLILEATCPQTGQLLWRLRDLLAGGEGELRMPENPTDACPYQAKIELDNHRVGSTPSAPSKPRSQRGGGGYLGSVGVAAVPLGPGACLTTSMRGPRAAREEMPVAQGDASELPLLSGDDETFYTAVERKLERSPLSDWGSPVCRCSFGMARLTSLREEAEPEEDETPQNICSNEEMDLVETESLDGACLNEEQTHQTESDELGNNPFKLEVTPITMHDI